MQIIDISLVEDTPGPSPRPPAQSKTLWGIVLLSVLVHVAILLSLSWSTPTPLDRQAPPIQAVLIRLQALTTEPVKPEPTILEQTLPETQQTPVETESLSAKEAELVTPSETPETESPVVESNAAETVVDPIAEDPIPEPPQASSEHIPDTRNILTQSDDSPAPASRNIRQSIGQSLQQQQMQMQQDMAEAAARAYREQKNSPDLRIGEYQPPAEPTPGEHEINCDKGINSSLAVVAGLFGGNVKCTQRNDFQQFIDKRLKKTHLDKD